MKFVDLEKLKLVNDYNFITKEFDLELTNADTIFDIKSKTRSAVEYLFDQTALETHIKVNLSLSEPIADLDDADAYFTTAVNVITSVILDSICIQPHKGRTRERRLDVPENLKVINANMSLLKKCINMQTYLNRFNISVDWTNNNIDYHYTMITQRGDEEQYDSIN